MDAVSSSYTNFASTIDASNGTNAASNVPIPVNTNSLSKSIHSNKRIPGDKLPIPSAKCGRTRDAIDIACGI